MLTLLQLTMSYLISLICPASRAAPIIHGHKRMPAKCWCNYPKEEWTVVHITDFSYQFMVQQYGVTLMFITGEVKVLFICCLYDAIHVSAPRTAALSAQPI